MLSPITVIRGKEILFITQVSLCRDNATIGCREFIKGGA